MSLYDNARPLHTQLDVQRVLVLVGQKKDTHVCYVTIMQSPVI